MTSQERENIQPTVFKADKPIPKGMVCIIAGFNFFDWTAPIKHLVIDEERMDEMQDYYQERKKHYENVLRDLGIPIAVRAAYDTYLYANGGINDMDSTEREERLYEENSGSVHLSTFYCKKAMICGEASIFAHQLISEDIPTQLVYGYMGEEPHAFLLVELPEKEGIGIFDVNNGNGEIPNFIDFPREVYGRFINSEISLGRQKDMMYVFQEGTERRVIDPLQTRRGSNTIRI